MSEIYHSKKKPGVLMNQYGVVMLAGNTLDGAERAEIVREAITDGWHLVQLKDRDAGLVFVPPETPDDGKGEQ
jgi:hypothetical protein